jgi:hypothetical protein
MDQCEDANAKWFANQGSPFFLYIFAMQAIKQSSDAIRNLVHH